jgi:hypothetical protein
VTATPSRTSVVPSRNIQYDSPGFTIWATGAAMMNIASARARSRSGNQWVR